jgi:hypothetical protein
MFNVVVQAVKGWIPERKYAKENKYKDDLMRFLMTRLSSEDYSVRKGSILDIEINDEIGIELKRNLKSHSQRTRLIGQIHRFMEEHCWALVVLCGDVEQKTVEDLNFALKRYMSKHTSSPLFRNKRLEIISKDASKIRREKNKPNPLIEKILSKPRFSLRDYMEQTQRRTATKDKVAVQKWKQ